jgi:hypothetical protein
LPIDRARGWIERYMLDPPAYYRKTVEKLLPKAERR